MVAGCGGLFLRLDIFFHCIRVVLYFPENIQDFPVQELRLDGAHVARFHALPFPPRAMIPGGDGPVGLRLPGKRQKPATAAPEHALEQCRLVFHCLIEYMAPETVLDPEPSLRVHVRLVVADGHAPLFRRGEDMPLLPVHPLLSRPPVYHDAPAPVPQLTRGSFVHDAPLRLEIVEDLRRGFHTERALHDLVELRRR